jgi:hypothetical protein
MEALLELGHELGPDILRHEDRDVDLGVVEYP